MVDNRKRIVPDLCRRLRRTFETESDRNRRTREAPTSVVFGARQCHASTQSCPLISATLCAPSLGNRYPDALGVPAKEYFAASHIYRDIPVEYKKIHVCKPHLIRPPARDGPELPQPFKSLLRLPTMGS
jgi:hypothetical protein